MNDLQHLRLAEAVLFASAKPIDEKALAARLPEGADIPSLLSELCAVYAERGVNLVQRGEGWAFRTAPDLAAVLTAETVIPRRIPRAALETLAIVAYHQPVTRAEIEEIRGVSVSQGTLDLLFEAGWVRPQGRKETPGRPVLWATTEAFLDHFTLKSLEDLPGLDELKAAGLLDPNPGLATYAARAPDDPPPAEEAVEPLDPGDEETLERNALADAALGTPDLAEDADGG